MPLSLFLVLVIAFKREHLAVSDLAMHYFFPCFFFGLAIKIKLEMQLPVSTMRKILFMALGSLAVIKLSLRKVPCSPGTLHFNDTNNRHS